MNVDDPFHEQNKQMQNENSWNVNDVDNPFTDGRKAEPKYTPNDSFPSLSEQSTKEGLRNEIKELTSLEVHHKTSTDILQENITPSVNPLVHTKDKLKLFQSGMILTNTAGSARPVCTCLNIENIACTFCYNYMLEIFFTGVNQIQSRVFNDVSNSASCDYPHKIVFF